MGAKSLWVVLGLVFSPGLVLAAGEGDVEEILAIHKALIAAHLEYDVDALLEAEPDSILVVSRGEVQHQKRAERIEQYRGYLGSARFSEYRDLIEPIVRVSEDGTMGWLIAQVKIAGQWSGDGSEAVPFDWTWAWIELYEKQDGRWRRIGEVSNMKPQGS